MKRKILSRGSYRFLKILKSYDFQGCGWSCPGQDTLAKDLRVSGRQIKRYVAELTQKGYISVSPRPNASNKYTFLQNVPTGGTQNVPPDVPPDVPTIHLILKTPNAKGPTASQSRESSMSEMPYYYTTSEDQKLWRMAQHWIAANNPDLSAVTGDKARPIMYALEAAGGRSLPENADLPAISWPPEATPKPEIRKDTIPRKPMHVADLGLEALRAQIGGPK